MVLCDVISEFSRTEETIQSAVRYPSDLTDEEGEILEPIINELESYTIGRPRKSDLRDLLNAIFYLNKTGCPWRYLPKDFPPYKLVNYYYNKWTDNRLPEKANTVLRQRLRQKKDRKPDPTGAVIDSQSVKGTPESYAESEFDGANPLRAENVLSLSI